MKCPKCHADNPETKQFCGDCGTPLPTPRPQDHPPVVTETLQTPVRELTTGSTLAGYTNGTVTVFVGESRPRRMTRNAPTGEEFVVTDHLDFSMGRREDVDAVATAMAAAGYKPLFSAQEYPEFGPGFYAVTFCDPDNNVLEFGHRASPAADEPPKG